MSMCLDTRSATRKQTFTDNNHDQKKGKGEIPPKHKVGNFCCLFVKD
jgi:hypothetical protein